MIKTMEKICDKVDDWACDHENFLLAAQVATHCLCGTVTTIYLIKKLFVRK